MSAEAVAKVLAKAQTDADFRAKLKADPSAALSKFRSLTKEEIASLSQLPASVIDGLATLGQSSSKKANQLTFRDYGAMGLTVVLVLIFVPVLVVTLYLINSDPRGVVIGQATQVVDSYGRAKDILSIVLPLFSAAVTFWLGVAIEGRRADTNAQTAERAAAEGADAKRGQQAAKDQEHQTRLVAVDALNQAEAGLAAVDATQETVERRGVGGQAAPDIGQIRDNIRAAKTQLLEPS